MSDNEEENRLTASEVCLPSIQEDCILDDVKEEENSKTDKLDHPENADKSGSESDSKPDTSLGEKEIVEEISVNDVNNVPQSSSLQEENEILPRTRRMKRKLEEKNKEATEKNTSLQSAVINGTDCKRSSVESDLLAGTAVLTKPDDYEEIPAVTMKKSGKKLLKQNFLDDSLRSKENSESDTRVSTTSENSTHKKVVVRKKKGQRRFWFRRKNQDKKTVRRKDYESDLTGSTIDDYGSGNTSPSFSENFHKNRKFSDSSDSSKKNREFAIPSPSLADISMKAAIPESTATSVEVNTVVCH